MAVENTKKTAKKTVSLKDVKLNYLTGKPVDQNLVRAALSVLGMLVVAGIVFLLLGMMLVTEPGVWRWVLNLSVYSLALYFFFSNGSNKGMSAVNVGEVMYDHRQKGLEVDEGDLKRSYHPLKGFIVGALGCLPMALIALVLALTAQQQMTSIGALPSWVSAYGSRSDLVGALGYYHQTVTLTITDFARIFTRMLLMPIVNIVSSYGNGALLTLEHVSPLLMLLPGLAYGLGYTRGVNMRKMVHIGIAEGETKRKKKEKRQRRRQQRQTQRGPEQLN